MKTAKRLMLQPGSEWIYDVHYEAANPHENAALYVQDTARKVELVEINIMPYRVGPGPWISVPEVLSSRIHMNHKYSEETPQYFPVGASNPALLQTTDLFISTVDGTIQYSNLRGLSGQLPLQCEISYSNYKLESGSNIGQPYEVGNSWSYTLCDEIFHVNGSVRQGTWYWTANVKAAGETVEVPAGKFTDCFVIEHRISDTHGVVRGTIIIEWWSPTVMSIVKSIDYYTYVGEHLSELQSYNLIWGDHDLPPKN